jgi:hypothetical protein
VTGNLYVVNALGIAIVSTLDAPGFLAAGWAAAPWASEGAPVAGVATINFGAFPGSSSATVTFAAPTPADANSQLSAWIIPVATADHSADEHIVDPPRVSAALDGLGNAVITGVSNIPNALDRINPGPDPMPYGAWSVAWAFSP